MNYYNIRTALWVLICSMILSCAENKQATKELNVYFDLDSLLDLQVQKLSTGKYKLIKAVMMDGALETQTRTLDSTQWESEFVIMRDFDLNKPYNVGAYDKSQEDGNLIYTLADKTLDAPVQYFRVKSDGKIVITSDYFEDKSIYQHRRKLQLTITQGILESFEIRGFQKMVMKDTIHYRIAGEIKSYE